MIKKVFSQLGVIFLHLISFLPLSILYAIADFLYLIVYYLVKYRRKIVRKNLTRSFPDKNLEEIITIEKRFYRYFGELMVETVKMSSISKKSLSKRVKVKNFDLAEAYFSKNESVLAAASHYGNWEMCMMAMSIYLTIKPTAIYKPLNNEVFDKWFIKFRSKFGIRMITMRQTLREVIATKDQTSIFMFGSDQSPRIDDSNHVIQFLNQKTTVLVGLEKIAKQTKRPVFYFDFKRIKRGHYEIDCIPLCLNPLETAKYELTEKFFEQLDVAIQRDPAFWLWSHNRWKLNP